MPSIRISIRIQVANCGDSSPFHRAARDPVRHEKQELDFRNPASGPRKHVLLIFRLALEEIAMLVLGGCREAAIGRVLDLREYVAPAHQFTCTSLHDKLGFPIRWIINDVSHQTNLLRMAMYACMALEG
jgi:hypothetical protein